MNIIVPKFGQFAVISHDFEETDFAFNPEMHDLFLRGRRPDLLRERADALNHPVQVVDGNLNAKNINGSGA